MANVAPVAFIVKQETPDKEDILISSSHFFSSIFIDLIDCFDENVSLHVSFDVNTCGPFLALVLGMSTLEGMPSNLNQF
jgi:hypothetical protein